MFAWRSGRHGQILEHVPEGVCFVSLEGIVQYWNKAAESLTGYPAADIVGRKYSELPLVMEDERGNVLQHYEYPVSLCLQEKKEVSKYFFITTRDNRKIPVEESAVPLYRKGKLSGIVATFRDISSCIRRVSDRLKTERKERLIPICGWCKKIRSDENFWEQLEVYLTNEGFGVFTHGMCPSCADKIFEKKIYLESYQDICRSISASISLDEVLQLIVTNVVKVMNVKASSLRLLDKEKQQLDLVAYHGLSEKYANKGPVAYDASIDDALAGKPVSEYDVSEHENSKYYKEAMEEGIRSILSIPLKFEKEIIGVLRMYTSEPVQYTEEDMQFISAIAEQAGIAIVNARRFEREVSREKEYLRVFEEVTKAVSSSLKVEEVLNLIVRKIPEVLGLRAGSLRLLNAETKQLELVAYHGLSEKYANKGPVAYDASIDDALAGMPVSMYDILKHKDSRYHQEALEEGIRTILSIPVRFQHKVIGVLRLYSGTPMKHSDEDLRFMVAMAEQIAVAIVNAKQFEKAITKEKEYLKVFEEVTRAVNSTLNVRELLEMIVKKIPEVMGLKAATIRLLDNTGKKLKLVAASGLSEKYLNRGPVDTEENIIEALNENPVAILDVSADSKINYQKEAAEEGIKSMLSLPVKARGKVLGVIRLLTGEPREFTNQEIDFAVSLAEQCGMAIENATMYEKVKKEYNDIMKYLDGAVWETD